MYTVCLNGILLIFFYFLNNYFSWKNIYLIPIYYLSFFMMYTLSLILNSFWLSDIYSDAIRVEK